MMRRGYLIGLFLLLMFIAIFFSNPDRVSACRYTRPTCGSSRGSCWYACVWTASPYGSYWKCSWLGSCQGCCSLDYVGSDTDWSDGYYWWQYNCSDRLTSGVDDPKGTACDGKIVGNCQSTGLGDKCESGTYIGDDVVSVSCQRACDGKGNCNQCIPPNIVSPCRQEDCAFPMCNRITKTTPQENCSDNIDNDCDGDIDLDDFDCIAPGAGDWVIDGNDPIIANRTVELKKAREYKLTNRNLWVINGGTLTLYENVILTISKNNKTYLRSGGKIYLKKGAKIRYQ